MKTKSYRPLLTLIMTVVLTSTLFACGPGDIPFDPWDNPDARADAFRLFYKERINRVLLAYNRFSLVNDVVPAHTLGATYIDKGGDTYDILLHPKDNNEIGTSAFTAYHAYKVFRSRELALTLVRLFEGLAVAEEVSGIPGLTCREWQTGFTLTIDGLSSAITRTRDGLPVDPAEMYPAALEEEIIDAFFSDGVYTYRGDPTEYYFTLEPIIRPGDYGVTFVFEEMPDFLRVSDCCSSFMVSKLGTFAGYFWGNHNSRDNFPDYAMGYFAACEAMDDPEADADVRASAARACASGRRIGDSVVGHGYNLMTVSEFEPYDEEHLIVAGEIRPFGESEGPEWLGSMNSCQMAYMAKALSADGLASPFEKVENPGAYEIIAIKAIYELLGLTPPDMTKTCRSIDDAYLGKTWGELLDLELFGTSLWDLLETNLYEQPDAFVPLVKGLANAVHQPEKSAEALVYYARTFSGSCELVQKAREALYHILEVQRRSAQMLYDWAMDQPDPPGDIVNKAIEELTLASRYAHIAGIGGEHFTPYDFTRDEAYTGGFEAVLVRPDSTLRPLMTDEEIWGKIEHELNGQCVPRPPVYERYWDRFPTPEDMPLRRFGDHYEAVGLDGAFHEIPNIAHEWFGGVCLWDAIPLCTLEPTSLDCTWAILGCEVPDLDGSGTVAGEDQALFDAAWTAYGEGALCSEINDWCDGADLDRSGALEADDQEFMSIAQGCWY